MKRLLAISAIVVSLAVVAAVVWVFSGAGPAVVTIVNQSGHPIGPVTIFGPTDDWKKVIDFVQDGTRQQVELRSESYGSATGVAIAFEGPFGRVEKDANVYFTGHEGEWVTFTISNDLTVDASSGDAK